MFKPLREIYWQVKTHMLTQNQRCLSATDGKTCQYRSSEGLHCAVGCLIPDQYYNSDMEGCSISDMIETEDEYDCHYKESIALKRALIRSDINIGEEAIIDLLKDLQRVHDDHEPEEWEKEFKKLEERYGLEEQDQPAEEET